MAEAINTHGTGLLIDDTGLLLRGPSGAGKSLLALELMDWAEIHGRKALLVSDDRVDLRDTAQGLRMAAPDAIAGLIELRGRGIVRRPFVRECGLDLVIDLVDALERMPEEDALEIEICGRRVARCPVPRRGIVDAGHQRLLVAEAIATVSDNGRTTRQERT